MNADLIINGSSKALVQISPKIIDSVLNLNSYNLGMDGTGFIPQKMQYDLYLKYNKKPEIVVQIVSHGTLYKNVELYKYIKFAPYFDNEEIKKVSKKYKGFSTYDYYIPFIRYSGNPSIVINGLLNTIGIDLRKDNKYKGFLAQDKKWDNSFNDFKNNNPDGVSIRIEEHSIKLFENYIAECKNNNINVILVYPPTFMESKKYIKNEDEIVAYYKYIADKYQVPFLDYSDNVLSYSTEYFYNSQHLNRKGAELFTKELSVDIKNLLENNLSK